MMKFSEYYSVSSKNGLSKSFIDNSDGIKIVNMKELFGYNPIIDKVSMRTVLLSHSELDRFKLVFGDLLFGRRSLVAEGAGKTTIFKGEEPTVFESSIIRVRINKEKADFDFVNYYFNSPVGRGVVLSIVTGAAVFGIRGSDLKDIKVDFPPLKTQTKIANILSTYDDLIENNNQRIKLLEEMAEEIYKEWFVRMRFPAVAGKPDYKNTKFFNKEGEEVKHATAGALPEGWEVKRIKQIGKVVTGKTPPKLNKDNFDGNIPFIKTPDMQQGMFFVKTEETLSKEGANSQMSQYIPSGSVSVSCIGTVGKIGITIKPSQTNQQINSIIPFLDSALEYIFFSIKRIKPIIESYAATGATMANLSKSKFEKLKIVIPNDNLINDFNKIVKPFFGEIKILMQKNQILQQTRDLLLPRLISGKLNVEDLDLEQSKIYSPIEQEHHLVAESAVSYKTK